MQETKRMLFLVSLALVVAPCEMQMNDVTIVVWTYKFNLF